METRFIKFHINLQIIHPFVNLTRAFVCCIFSRKIFAFDKDLRRLSTMNMLSIRAGSICIDSSNQDFLKVDPSNSKYSNVKYILVDPSCSGSGENPSDLLYLIFITSSFRNYFLVRDCSCIKYLLQFWIVIKILLQNQFLVTVVYHYSFKELLEEVLWKRKMATLPRKHLV